MPIGDIYSCKAVSYDTTQIGLNVYHLRWGASSATEPTLLQIANAINTLWGIVYAPLLAVTASFRGVLLQKIRPLPLGAAVNSIGFVSNGTAGAVPLPKQTSGLIKLTTLLAGRHSRGRAYIPFPAAADNTGDGVPVPGYVTRLNSLATVVTAPITVVAGLNTITLVPVVYNRTAFTTQDITGFTARTVWATQRRRGDEGRTNLLPF